MADCRLCANKEYSPICSDCENGSNFEKESFTNADRIRVMDDEELADFLEHIRKSGFNGLCCNDDLCDSDGCDCCMVEWLQAEAEQKGE